MFSSRGTVRYEERGQGYRDVEKVGKPALDPQLVKKFPKCYEPRGFITPFTPRHLSLSPISSCSLEIHFNIILPYKPRSKCSFSFRFPHQNPVCLLLFLHTCHMPHPSHPP